MLEIISMRKLIPLLLMFLVSCGQKEVSDFGKCFDNELQESYNKLKDSFQLSAKANHMTKDNQSSYQTFVKALFDVLDDSLDTTIDQFVIPANAELSKSDMRILIDALQNETGDFLPQGKYMNCIYSNSDTTKRVISKYIKAKEMGSLNFLIIASGIYKTADQMDYEDESVKAMILFEIYLDLIRKKTAIANIN